MSIAKLKPSLSLYLILFLLICPPAIYGQKDTLRVLFLGNSYTAANNLPLLAASMAQAAGKTLLTDRNTPGGFTLDGHSRDANSLSKIRLGHWDYVVLQEQSQIPTIDHYRYNSMYPGGYRLKDSIEKYNPCTRIVLFLTWGRRFGGQQCDPAGTYCSPVFRDFDHMQDSLESAYGALAANLSAYLAPIGRAWKKVLSDTSLVLHTPDDSHPNYSGSFLAASVFYAVLWRESPLRSNFRGSLTPSLANYLQSMADSTVFHANTNWNLNVDQVSADFTFTVYGDSVQFSNRSQSLLPARYFWDFGDGNGSNLENPHHIYQANQSYPVTLRTESCGRADTATKMADILAVGTGSTHPAPGFRVYPNPFSDELVVRAVASSFPFRVKVYNARGILVARTGFNQQRKLNLPLTQLPPGIYLVQVDGPDQAQNRTFRIIKK